MTVPPTTLELLDLTISPLVANGSPVVADDQHNPDSTFDFDAINDWLSSTVIPFTNGVEKGTCSFWFFWDGTIGHILNQRPVVGGATGIWYITAATGGAMTLSYEETESGNEGVVSTSGTGVLVIDTWVHIFVTINLALQTCDIHKNGVEVSYVTHNNVIGTPGATLTTPSTLGVMSSNNDAGNNLPGGIPSRLKFWDNTILTDNQKIEEFNNEQNLLLDNGIRNRSSYLKGTRR